MKIIERIRVSGGSNHDVDRTDAQPLTELPLQEFVVRLGQPLPAPGGGAAAALTAALAVAMGRKVLVLAQHGELAPAQQQALAEAQQQLDRLGAVCGGLIDESIAACEAYTAAAQQAGSPGSHAALQATTRLAVTVPLEIAAVALRFLSTLGDRKGDLTPVLHAELAAGAYLAEAACHAACENAHMVAFQLDPQEDRADAQQQCQHLHARAVQLREQIVPLTPGQP